MKYFSLLFAHSFFLPLRSPPMKPRFSLLAAAALSIVFCAPASASDLTWTYMPTPSTTNEQTIAGVTITPTYVWKSTPYAATSSQMLQIGAGGKNVRSVTYDFSAFPSDIKSIAITGKTAADNSTHTPVSATIGTDSFSGSASLTSTEGTITLTAPGGTQTGTLSILIDNPRADSANSKSQAIYLRSIVVTYKDPAAAGLTKLGTPAHLLAPSTNYFGFALSWDPVTHATNGYTVTLSPADGNSGVTVSGTTATMTGLAEGETYAVSVVAKGDGTGTDDSEAATLSVTTLTAPAVSEPDLSYSVSASSLMVSWPAQNDAASYAVRAWTLVPADVATEDFAGYAANGTVPEGWTFQNSGKPYGEQDKNPVDFRNGGEWIGSPVFGGTITNISFRLCRQNESGSTFTVFGSTGSGDESDWKTAENTLATLNPLATQVYDIPIDVSKGITRVFFQDTKSSGNVSIGSFAVKGANVGRQPSYLTGYGPTAASTTSTSVTLTPVAGKTNYIEVSAVGQTGKTATATLAVEVPAAAGSKPVVISVK